MVHSEPDVDVVPCIACNELFDDADLVAHGDHGDVSSIFWYPYHFWCTRREPLEPVLDCVECAREHARAENSTPGHNRRQ